MNRFFLRTSDVGHLVGVGAETVRRWCEAGCGPHFFRSVGGHYRFRRPDVEKWLKELQTSDLELPGHTCSGSCHGDAA